MRLAKRFGLAVAVFGLLAVATGPAKAGVTFTFDSTGDVTTGPTQAPGTWYTDRYAPNGFASGQSGGGRTGVLTESINGSNYQGSGSFYNTQGRKYDLPTSTTTMSIELYVDSAWSSLDQSASGSGRLASFWATGVDSGNAISAYPIIEFNNDRSGTNDSGFRTWDDSTGSWTNVGGFSGYDQWYTLGITLVGGQAIYSINGATVGNDAYIGTASLSNVILQGYNAGNSYDIHWDNFSTVPEPATLISSSIAGVLCLGVAWRRRKAAKPVA